MFCFSLSLTNTFLFWLKTPVRHFKGEDGKMRRKARKVISLQDIVHSMEKGSKKETLLAGVLRFHNL